MFSSWQNKLSDLCISRGWRQPLYEFDFNYPLSQCKVTVATYKFMSSWLSDPDAAKENAACQAYTYLKNT